jgi:hypothetical protein
MKWQDLLADGYGRVPELFGRVLDKLSPEDLDWRPKQDSNSVGWLVWHATRGEDAQISDLIGDEQIWIKGRWYSKFNRTADPKDTGFGHKPKQLAAFKSPQARVLLDYQKAVTKRSLKYVKSLTTAELGRTLNEPWFQPLPTVGVRLISIFEDSILHGGEASYVRGLRQGMGWQKF